MRTKRKPDWENLLSVLEPQINAEGLHVWPFDASFPIDVRSFELAEPNNLRMNRHEYFEFTYIRSGQAVFQIQDRFFDVREGDLVVIGSTLYHRVTSCSRLPAKIIVLYFLPELVRGAAVAGDDVEYMMPFLIQDADFPHVIKSATGIPAQALDLMEKMRAEFPPRTVRSRLAVKTYLKMALMLIVNHYFDYSGAKQAFDRRMRAIARLRPLFEHLESHYDQPVTIEDAAETCAMSTSYFMRFLKAATGQSFLSYLNHFRIEKAQALLASTDKSISEVSQEIGFCDQSYFGVV
ncbi:MAG: AraC family transcriptional regulator, partial [Acidobacteria bacterium]|nr:AraC family transcriptional regulator [Acidobacteriota bacterium]